LINKLIVALATAEFLILGMSTTKKCTAVAVVVAYAVAARIAYIAAGYAPTGTLRCRFFIFTALTFQLGKFNDFFATAINTYIGSRTGCFAGRRYFFIKYVGASRCGKLYNILYISAGCASINLFPDYVAFGCFGYGAYNFFTTAYCYHIAQAVALNLDRHIVTKSYKALVERAVADSGYYSGCAGCVASGLDN
jgi:hypothetical protein